MTVQIFRKAFMGILTLFYLLFVTPTTAYDSGRKCTNLVIPVPRYLTGGVVPKSKVADRVPNSENKVEKFIALESIESQKLLAALLWNELKVKKSVDDRIAELDNEQKTMLKSKSALSVYTNIDADTAARAAERTKQMESVTRKLNSAHRQVEAALAGSQKLKLKNPIKDPTLNEFFKDVTLNKVQDFNRYVSEALLLNADAARVIELVQTRVRQQNEFSLLTKECMAGDPLAEAIARRNYELVNVYGKKTYVMNYECTVKKKNSRNELECLEVFKEGLRLKGCRIAEKVFCEAQGNKVKCSAETLNCFDQYRDEKLGSVSQAKGCPVGFRYENTEEYHFCLLGDN